MALPEAILEKFRNIALERVERIQRGWLAIAEQPDDAYLSQEVHREIHTLKGDSRVVGYTEVNALCQKLEELFHLAHDRGYRVTEELDLAIRMGLQFVAVLVRAKPGANVPGIDLPSFYRQIEAVLAADPEEESPPSTLPESLAGASMRSRIIPPRLRDELGTHATIVYLEALNVTGASHRRLIGAWRALTDIAVTLGGEELRPRLARFAHAASALADEAGKDVRIRIDAADLLVAPEVASAIEVAALHAVRNAVAHGIESPDERLAAGKSSAGWIEIRAVMRDGFVELSVEDDGRGIDVESVRRRAVMAGLVSAEAAAAMAEEDVLRLIFRAGLSTAASLTESSGRGIGLDAAHAAVVRIGGTVQLRSRRGMGAVLIAQIPHVSEVIDAQIFAIPGCPRRIAVPDVWRVDGGSNPQGPELLVLDALGLHDGARTANDSKVPARRIALRRDSTVVTLEVLSTPHPVRLRRLCPSSVAAPIEIVRVGDEEVILVRPDRIEARAVPSLRAIGPAPARSLRVLLIDDSEIFREQLQAALEAAVCDVRSVATIEELRATFSVWRPDIVVSDVQMPSVTGTDVCREVRARVGTGPAIPVILVSDFPESQLEELAWASGAQGFVVKALGPEKMARRVREIFESLAS